MDKIIQIQVNFNSTFKGSRKEDEIYHGNNKNLSLFSIYLNSINFVEGEKTEINEDDVTLMEEMNIISNPEKVFTEICKMHKTTYPGQTMGYKVDDLKFNKIIFYDSEVYGLAEGRIKVWYKWSNLEIGNQDTQNIEELKPDENIKTLNNEENEKITTPAIIIVNTGVENAAAQSESDMQTILEPQKIRSPIDTLAEILLTLFVIFTLFLIVSAILT